MPRFAEPAGQVLGCGTRVVQNLNVLQTVAKKGRVVTPAKISRNSGGMSRISGVISRNSGVNFWTQSSEGFEF